MPLIVDQYGNATHNAGELEIIHPQRDKGRSSGYALADDRNYEGTYITAIDAALTCLQDETTAPELAEKVYENIVGIAEGLSERLAVKPLLFLSRSQTVYVSNLPRRIRRAWMSEYNRGVKAWQKAGGSLSGKRPVLPEIPG